MELIRDSIRKQLPPLRLHIDDIREIYEFITENYEKVRLSAAGYHLESIDELRELPVSSIHNLEISASNPFIHIMLSESFAQFSIQSGDIQTEGIATRLESILLKSRAKVYFLPIKLWAFFIVSLPLYAGIVLDHILTFFVGFLIVLMYATIFVIDYRFKFNSYTTVLPIERKEQTSFWKRNKDQIILLVIGVVIGLVIKELFNIIIGLL